MVKRAIVPALLSLLLLSFCATTPVQNTAAQNVAAHWSYTGDTGPAYWHTLDGAYRIAAEGQAQSPVNIDTASLALAPGLGRPVFNYTETEYELENNGHTIELVPEGEGNRLTLDGADYALQQFHFHSPGEHRIDGKTFDLEVHFVHKTQDGSIAVAGVLFNEGAENTILKELFTALEREAPPAGHSLKLESPLNPAGLFAASMYRYDGSLTTPPCTEGVKWSLSSRSQELSKAQLAAFRALYKGNNRPVQDLHGRPVYLSGDNL
ncbi:carbonic anhydrase [Spirochaetia bacterium]|nr:carbonic anhydrase [Spirochaetia bacterium]